MSVEEMYIAALRMSNTQIEVHSIYKKLKEKFPNNAKLIANYERFLRMVLNFDQEAIAEKQ